MPIFQICTYNDRSGNKHEQKHFVYKRCLDEDSVNKFIKEVSNIEWNDVLSEQNPNVAHDRFTNKIIVI